MNLAGSFRFAIAAGLIASTALLLQARGRTEIVPQHLPLSSFPEQLGNWNGTDIALDKDTLAVLGNGDFMERVYQGPFGQFARRRSLSGILCQPANRRHNSLSAKLSSWSRMEPRTKTTGHPGPAGARAVSRESLCDLQSGVAPSGALLVLGT